METSSMKEELSFSKSTNSSDLSFYSSEEEQECNTQVNLISLF